MAYYPVSRKLFKYFIKPSLAESHFCLFRYLEQINDLWKAVFAGDQLVRGHGQMAWDACRAEGVGPLSGAG